MCDRGVFSTVTKDLSFVDARILAQAPNEEPRELSDSFQPGARDVICSRGADCYNHSGNQFFRLQLDVHLDAYGRAPNKLAKGLIVSEVIEKVREEGGSFVRQDPKTRKWFEVGDRLAREKTGQAMRSALRKNGSPATARCRIKKNSSPSSSLGDSKSSDHANLHVRSIFADELCKTNYSLRGTGLQDLLIEGTDYDETGAVSSDHHLLPGRIPSISSTFNYVATETRQLQSSQTWSGIAYDNTLTAPRLRRAYTDPSQINDAAQSFALAPPPPVALNRDVSTWSSNIERLPGLLDYDPFLAGTPALALRRMSSDFVSLSGIPLEIEVPHEGDEEETKLI